MVDGMEIVTTTVEIDTETGSRAVVNFTHDLVMDVYTLKISGQVIDQALEGVTASVQLALRELAGWRSLGAEG